MHAEVAEQEVRRRPNDGEVDKDRADHASGVGDGAGICILTTRERAHAEGWEIIGKYVASAFVGKCSDRSQKACTTD